MLHKILFVAYILFVLVISISIFLVECCMFHYILNDTQLSLVMGLQY